ncbi:MAG: D-2-hydroxyacid dehydrogenase [Bacteroidetes bacterium]|nr:3-phosphoglycerate dehydrogenase [Bacteroidota bacterium]MCL4815624.1 D-2-hydroxyacid dehydrogenase [Flavobacteriales bacterium]NOG94238.1 D-2-hydroxyacid dehydrogenase [Bacteroidota bacterium]WKZ76676.1 MAG: D-2-hydroxyacid dehydrogenase [Vicingaceae bacterium]
MKILANDGIDDSGKKILEESRFIVITDTKPVSELASFINQQNIQVLLVRSATKVRKELIDECAGLKIIGRGGVGMDNIDVAYAKEKGIEVINTPAASSQSVAELVFAHLFSCVRFLHQSNAAMHHVENGHFNELKKSYSKGIELRGKTLGIIGFGRIGQSLASYALGCGMKVVAYDPFVEKGVIKIAIEEHVPVEITVKTKSFDEVLTTSDFISLHVPMPNNGQPIIGETEMKKMKKGIILINASRGGIVDEIALLTAIHSKHLFAAALDVFENEPEPSPLILSNKNISLSPHIGASTIEAQERIGSELAEKIIAFFSK